MTLFLIPALAALPPCHMDEVVNTAKHSHSSVKPVWRAADRRWRPDLRVPLRISELPRAIESSKSLGSASIMLAVMLHLLHLSYLYKVKLLEESRVDIQENFDCIANLTT